MSAFRRCQSKVFWARMATQDSDHGRVSDDNDSRERLAVMQLDDELFRREDAGESSEESDTTGGRDVTAIRVYRSSNDEFQKDPTFHRTTVCNENATDFRSEFNDEARSDVVRMPAAQDRSCSPLSQDLRSQDSGFSDSEKSHCSEIAYDNETPRRRRRRSRRQRQKRSATTGWEKGARTGMHPRIDSICSADSTLPHPTYTSTPKDSRTRPNGRADRNRRRACLGARSVPNVWASDRSGEGDENDQVASGSAVSLDDESLGDFLYATEPPEDAVETRPAKPTTIRSAEGESRFESKSKSKSIIQTRTYRQSSSVRAWLCNLAVETHNECGVTLQSKSLPRRQPGEFVCETGRSESLRALSSAATAAANKLLVRINQFERHYLFVIDKVSHLEAGRAEKELVRVIEEDAYGVLSELGAPPPRRIQLGSPRGILSQLEHMKNYVDSVFDTRLDFYMERVVRGLEEAPREQTDTIRGSLAALTVLGLAGPRAGSSVARCSGVKSLLTTLLLSTSGRSNDTAAACLRALSSICSSRTAIECFANIGGPEIVTDILLARSTSEKEKMEATSLVVQITAAWTNAAGLPYLEPFADALIPALCRLIESTDCGQTLLLVAAGLNQLSRSRRCAAVILREDAVARLLNSVKRSGGGNVWLMEQVACLVGELARTDQGRLHLAKARASVALICFLKMRPAGLEDAYHRLEITAAAALTRLCCDPEIARQVVAVGGADCLPSCSSDPSDLVEDEHRTGSGLLTYTKSLRRACRKAAKQIDIARSYDPDAIA